MRLFDTGTAATQPLTDDAIGKRAGWSLVPEEKVDHAFSGDAVALNDKLAVVIRKQGLGAEIYSKAAIGLRHRATLGHVGKISAMRESCRGLTILENTAGSVMLETRFQGAGTAALRFRLTTGEAILEIRPGEEAGLVDVSTRARYVVVPDFFGDDLVFGREAFRGHYLPAENFCLQLLEGGDAMLMSVWQSSEQDVWLAPSSGKETKGRLQGANENVLSSQIRCLKGKSIWLAFLECPDIWHTSSLSAKDEWKPPFPARWRKSLVRENCVADSWDMERGPLAEQTSGVHQGPLLVYPIDRGAATPLTATCPTDVMRNTLGVGPCQYILAVEGMNAQGDPTPNSVMTWIEKQFELRKEKKLTDDIKERLQFMVDHVGQARAKLEGYAQFAGQLRNILASRPDLAPIRSMVEDLDRFATNGLASEASPLRVKQLAHEVAALIGKESPLASCQRLGEQLRSAGALQDRSLAKCRMAVRRLKAIGQEMMLAQPQNGAQPQELVRLAEQVLRGKPAGSGPPGGMKP